MNEVKFKIWQVVIGLFGALLAGGALVASIIFITLAYSLEQDKYNLEQYKQSYHEWNEDRKHKKTNNN